MIVHYLGRTGALIFCSWQQKIFLQLDNGIASDCEERNVSFVGLRDGSHSLEVCTNAPQGVGCASYNWTVG